MDRRWSAWCRLTILNQLTKLELAWAKEIGYNFFCGQHTQVKKDFYHNKSYSKGKTYGGIKKDHFDQLLS